ncbi:MAG: phosphodiester glycosidase family protein [Oscillospiraceae bacterium]|nr:phosphodiester glycosidase family protein [Oscillospiraceae bacterium]
MGKYERKKRFSPWRILLTVLVSIPALILSVNILSWAVVNIGVPGNSASAGSMELAIMDRYDMQMTNEISSALEGVLSIEKVYWLNDDDQIAPEPDQEKFGTTTDPASMQSFLDEAKELLGVEDTVFSTDVTLMHGSKITYYLDETIMVITWKEIRHGSVYTISEVKIAHPSQFRRFVADGVYGSDKQYQTTDMAATVNAVTASSGDFYKFRSMGVSVYQGQVMRMNNKVDTCFITEDGDMLFVPRGTMSAKEEAQKFVDENKVRFSLAFGPILVDDFQKVPVKGTYPLGEVEDMYPRAALCKMGDDLHYLLIASNQEGGYDLVPDISTFSDEMVKMGCEKAYALDGGQTAVIVTNDKLINRPSYGYQRLISDIIYFATAIPDGG